MSLFKRILSAIICFVIIITNLPININAEKGNEDSSINVENLGSAVLIDATTYDALYELNKDKKMNVAGLTRLAPLLIICDAFDKGDIKGDDVITISRDASKVPGQTIFLEANEKINAESLLKGGIMILAGDAIYALCEHIYGSTSLERLNNRLDDIGVNVKYDSIMGDNIEWTAMDLATLSEAISQSKTFLAYSSLYMDTITHSSGRKTEIVNQNKLIKTYSGCVGLATSSSSSSGYNGVFCVNRANLKSICVIIGAKNSTERFNSAKKILDYGENNFKINKVALKGDIIVKDVVITGGTKKSVNLICLEDVSFLTKKDEKLTIDLSYVPESLDAPVNPDSLMIDVPVIDGGGKTLGYMQLVVDDDVELIKIGDFIAMFISLWVMG